MPTSEEILEKELPKFKKAAKEITKKATKSKKAAREFLYKSGIYTKTGRLRKQYRD